MKIMKYHRLQLCFLLLLLSSTRSTRLLVDADDTDDTDMAQECAGQPFLMPYSHVAAFDNAALAVFPLSNFVILGLNGGGYVIIDVATGDILERREGFADKLGQAVAVDSAEEFAFVSFGSDIAVWRLENGSHERTITTHSGAVMDIEFTPDGTKMVTADTDTQVIIWDYSEAGNPQDLHILDSHSSSLTAIAISPDGQYVASASYDSTTVVWDMDGNQLLTLSHDDDLKDVTWDANSEYILTGFELTVTVWKLSDGSQVNSFEASSYVYELMVHPDNSILYVLTLGNIEEWDWANPTSAQQTFATDLGSSVKAVLAYDVEHIVAVDVSGVKIYDVPTRTLQQSVELPEGQFEGLAISPDSSKVAISSDDGYFRLYSLPDLEPLWTVTKSWTSAGPVHFSPDGSVVAYSDLGDIIIRDVSDSSLVSTVDTVGTIIDFCYSPDGSTVVTGHYSGEVYEYVVATGSGRRAGTHSDGVTSVAYSPDGNYVASGSKDQTVIIWDASDMSLLHTLTDFEDRVLSVGFTLDSSALITSDSDNSLKSWNPATGESIIDDDSYSWALTSMDFVSNGNFFVAANSETVVVIDPTTLTTEFVLWDPLSFIREVRVSADGNYVAVSADDGLIIYSACWGCSEDPAGFCHVECPAERTYWNPETQSCEPECPFALFSDSNYHGCFSDCDNDADKNYDEMTCEYPEYEEQPEETANEGTESNEDEEAEEAEEAEVSEESEQSEEAEEEAEEEAGEPEDSDESDSAEEEEEGDEEEVEVPAASENDEENEESEEAEETESAAEPEEEEDSSNGDEVDHNQEESEDEADETTDDDRNGAHGNGILLPTILCVFSALSILV